VHILVSESVGANCCYLFLRFLQLKSQLAHQATIIGPPGDTTLRKTQVPAVTTVGQHSKKGACA
jgi:hypothetical protein